MQQRVSAVLLSLILALAWPMVTYACLTPERAAVMQLDYPGFDYRALAGRSQPQSPSETRLHAAADCVGGQADQFECSNIRLAGWLTLGEIGGGSGGDHWGWVHRASGRMFALMGRSNGTAFVEVTDPDQPVYLGNLPRASGVSSTPLTDIKTYRDHAFIVADNVTGQGMQVFDLTRLLTIGESAPVTFTADAHYDSFDEAHNIAINEDTGFAYAVGGEQCSGGLLMIDIGQPTDPQPAGCFSADGYTHDVHCVVYQGPDSDHLGRELCFASNEDRLSVIDVTDKAVPFVVSSHYYDHGYVHQGWLTEDQRHFILDDEVDEQTQTLAGTRTLIFDLQDLDQSVTPESHIGINLTFDHNQYVIGDYVFQANYEQGLRVLRIDDASDGQMTEVAYFDTHPEGNALDWDGAWSVFPYLGNATVLVSDINRGLFILEVTDPAVVKALRDVIFADKFRTP